MTWVIFTVVAIMAVQQPFAGNTGVVEAGLWAIGNLAEDNEDNNRRLEAAGACEGE